MDNQANLFDWADAQRPSAKIIDARKLFQKRTLNFVRMIAIGYPFKTEGGAPVFSTDQFTARRKARIAEQEGAKPSHQGRATA